MDFLVSNMSAIELIFFIIYILYIYTLIVQIMRSTNYRDVFILLTFFFGGGCQKWKSEILRNTNYRYVFILLD